ncbi:hypothetical protein J1N35_040167 [Gossypium stocksii]|uniref:Uncharacterized protein n=1 Tax=Gossypium stocksii TaxID=47602 RepID=A0A9D3UDP1_9ROSI|nr:hypothetical protein J1N35_040167 [Gossypium stocksii]
MVTNDGGAALWWRHGGGAIVVKCGGGMEERGSLCDVAVVISLGLTYDLSGHHTVVSYARVSLVRPDSSATRPFTATRPIIRVVHKLVWRQQNTFELLSNLVFCAIEVHTWLVFDA